MGEGDELRLLTVMLEELNLKFALQLDLSPNTDRSCPLATDEPDEEGIVIVLAGSSHSTRLNDHLESANCKVGDSTVSCFRVSESSVSAMVEYLTEKSADLDNSKTVLLIQLLDNSISECKLPNGNRSLLATGRTIGTMPREI
jgi:hypothetical protein